MMRSGERAYVYAKACGIIGKSFVGKRMAALGTVNRLSDLDRMIFPDSSRDLPERELLGDLEERIIHQGVRQILGVMKSFAAPPELLIRLLRTYEYADLKSALNGLANRETRAPSFIDLGRFQTIHFEAYPDLKAMLRATEFEFILKEQLKSDLSLVLLQTRLDQHYYTAIWNALGRLKQQERQGIEGILAEELSLRNIVWALRLRTYYGMSAQAIPERLLSVEGVRRRPGARGWTAFQGNEDAIASLSLPLDSFSPWARWKRVKFLNPEQPGAAWTADPRYFQNAVSRYLYRLARLAFRRRPFSLDTAACFIKLKQFEEDLLTSMAEGLGMGLSGGEVLGLLEVVS